MKEIELKVLDINQDNLKRTLKKLKAKQLLRPTTLTEICFKINHKRNLRLFRLRQEGNKTCLTVKQAINGKKFLAREETEITVSNFATTKKILEIVGFKVLYYRQKIREEYYLSGVKIEIDRYPKMNPYLELEGSPDKIKKILSQLGYSMNQTTNKTSTAVIKAQGLKQDRLLFKP